MAIIHKLKETYYRKKDKYRQLKQLKAQLSEINALIKAVDGSQHKESRTNFGGLKQADLVDLRGIKDVTDSVQD